jgi:hypothetical protein
MSVLSSLQSRRRAIIALGFAVAATVGFTLPVQEAHAAGCPPTALVPQWDGYVQASPHAIMNCTGSYTIRLAYYDTGTGTWKSAWEHSGTANAGAVLPTDYPHWVLCGGWQVRTWAYANVNGAGASDTSNPISC